MYFLPSLCLIFWMSAPMESFSFRATECQSDSLTVPNPPVTRRAAITLTTTVIEPQPVTVPPACILLGSTIKHWCSAFFTLCVCCWEDADLAVRDSWMQQDFLLVCLARLSFSFWGLQTYKHRGFPSIFLEIDSHRYLSLFLSFCFLFFFCFGSIRMSAKYVKLNEANLQPVPGRVWKLKATWV